MKVIDIPVLTVGSESINLTFPLFPLTVTGTFNYFMYYIVQSVYINLAEILCPLQFNLISLAFEFLTFFSIPFTLLYKLYI